MVYREPTDEEVDVMTEQQFEDAVQAWLNARPPAIRAAFERFPIGTQIQYSGETLFMIGFAERDDGGVSMICSRLSPFLDYAAATADDQKIYICLEHFDGPDNR